MSLIRRLKFRNVPFAGAPQDADALITVLDRAEHASRLIVRILANPLKGSS